MHGAYTDFYAPKTRSFPNQVLLFSDGVLTMRLSSNILFGLLGFFLVVLVTIASGMGYIRISPGEVVSTIFHALFSLAPADDALQTSSVVITF